MSDGLPEQVKVVEVGPRDGLQNEITTIPTKIKIKFIDLLSACGFQSIEATSFVSPQWVPQMADHSNVLENITRFPTTRYPVLVPNEKGFHAAVAAGADEIAVFTTASNQFAIKNTNCTAEESLQRCQHLIELANQRNIPVRAYISCAVACPFEGPSNPMVITDLAKQLLAMNCYEVSLGDTIGVATPLQIKRLLSCCLEQVDASKLAIHCHDTFGQAIANIYAALEMGISTIDSAAAGLGGCPYAPGASGNVATEDVIYLLNGLGIKTGIDLTKLLEASAVILKHLKRDSLSKAARALQSKTNKP